MTKTIDAAGNLSPARPLTAQQAAAFVGLSVPGFWAAVRARRLPSPVYPLPRAPRWQAAELTAALEATRALPTDQMAARRDARIAADAA